MKRAVYEKSLVWLRSNPTLDALCAKYPADWQVVQQDVSSIVARGVAEELKAYLDQASKPAALTNSSLGARQVSLEVKLSAFVRSRMAREAIKKLCLTTLAADTGVKKGKLRFNLLNGYIIQKLLFTKGLERKPASLFWFKLIWPLVWQKKRLMALVQPRGIYCFYSRPLIEALTKMIASRSCLEIGAGDGTLTRFLTSNGVQITASDSHDWSNVVNYPDWVAKLDAREALSTYVPEVVICSWPPSENVFERYVFNTPSVQLYIVIGSRHHFAFGNWKDYRQQTTFTFEEDAQLGALLLPPELGSAVYVFRRNTITDPIR
jgi:hypothetical protein